MAPTDPWLVIQHVAHEGPGAIGNALSGAGKSLRVVRIDEGEDVPGPETVQEMAGLVVMGGPMGANDDLGWLQAEGR
jgi:GMP synthase (glutamine-hydrolysing)